MEDRKNPDEILKKIKEEESTLKKGKLRIFFGMAAGVGKTCQMLESAHIAQKDGHDILVGYIETHSRKDTERLCKNLEILDRKEIVYKDTIVQETDIDEIISRKPEIVLIDELAHTNAPGSRHKKRFQDILEILNYGIDVWTTVNVQHIESKAAVVEQITGIKIGETVPDFIIEMADKIEIIDITPEELQKRLKDGKIYAPEKINTALNNFFREGNITALREISLQTVAKLVDKDILEYRNEHNISESWKASDRLLVAVGPSPFSAYLIKWTKKTAFNMKADWIAVNIENSRELSKEQKIMLGNNLELARQLGAKIVTTVDEDIVSGLIRTAQQYNVSQIVVGKPVLFNLKDLLKKGISDRLIRESGDIDVYVVSQPGAKAKVKKLRPQRFNLKFTLKENLFLLISFGLVIGFNLLIQGLIGYWGVSLVFLVYIIFISSQFSRKSSIIASIFSALVWNYLFIPPHFTFFINRTEDALMYLTFFIVAIVTGNLTSKLHVKEEFLRKKEKNLEILYELSKEIANNADFNEVMAKCVEYISKYFSLETTIYLYNDNNNETHIFPEKNLEEKDKDIALWVIRNGGTAGRGTDTLSESDNYFYPIKSNQRTEGVIILKVNSKNISENEEFLKTVSFMIGSSIMKDQIVKMNQKILIETETEKLYSIILKSISHELKTPVTSISLSVNGLCDEKLFSDKETRNILLHDIKDANERLSRVITNLLDMTRIESGKLKLNLQWNDINDLLSSAANKYSDELQSSTFIKTIQGIIPPVKFDYGLIEQVISNILYNAIIHTKPGTTIEMKADTLDDNIFIEIIDNGGGIKNSKKIYDKFYKEDPKKTGGLGIGLSICKAIIEFHHWNLTAFNNDIGGATFRITIPRKEGD